MSAYWVARKTFRTFHHSLKVYKGKCLRTLALLASIQMHFRSILLTGLGRSILLTGFGRCLLTFESLENMVMVPDMTESTAPERRSKIKKGPAARRSITFGGKIPPSWPCPMYRTGELICLRKISWIPLDRLATTDFSNIFSNVALSVLHKRIMQNSLCAYCMYISWSCIVSALDGKHARIGKGRLLHHADEISKTLLSDMLHGD